MFEVYNNLRISCLWSKSLLESKHFIKLYMFSSEVVLSLVFVWWRKKVLPIKKIFNIGNQFRLQTGNNIWSLGIFIFLLECSISPTSVVLWTMMNNIPSSLTTFKPSLAYKDTVVWLNHNHNIVLCFGSDYLI